MVKTRLSGFCPASEQDRGRCSRLVSVGSGCWRLAGPRPLMCSWACIQAEWPQMPQMQLLPSGTLAPEPEAAPQEPAPSPTRGAHVPISWQRCPAVWPGSSRVTWKGNLGACMKVDNTHFWGSETFSFSAAGSPELRQDTEFTKGRVFMTSRGGQGHRTLRGKLR